MSCCSAACESCPASFCKDSDADKAPKPAVPALMASAPSVRAAEPIARFEPIARRRFPGSSERIRPADATLILFSVVEAFPSDNQKRSLP